MAARNVPTRSASRPAPAHPFEALRQEMDDLFSDFFRRPLGWGLEVPGAGNGTITPRLDVSETDKKFEVVAELPGVEEKDLDVSVSDGVLTIKATKEAEKEEKGKTWHRVERSFGTYQRSLSLPASADADKIKAAFEKGVLTISVPKRAELQPPTRKISIKSS